MINFKTHILRLSILIILFDIFTTPAFSQRIGGGFAGAYLLKEIGTRPISLAGAFTAVSNDPYTIFYNPAGLSSCAPVPMFYTSYSLMEHSRSYANLTYAQSINNFGLGVTISTFNSGNILARTKTGTEIGKLSDYFYNISVGGAFSTNFSSFGLTFKYLNNTLQGYDISANGLAFDFGTKFNVLDLFSLGISVQNIGAFLKYNTREEKSNIPFIIRTGVAMEFPLSAPKIITFRNDLGFEDTILQPPPTYLLITVESNYIQYEKHPNIICAFEFSPFELLAFRGGITVAGDDDGKFKLLPSTIWGAGFSIKPNIEEFYNLFCIDFSIGNDYFADKRIFYTIGIGIQF